MKQITLHKRGFIQSAEALRERKQRFLLGEKNSSSRQPSIQDHNAHSCQVASLLAGPANFQPAGPAVS